MSAYKVKLIKLEIEDHVQATCDSKDPGYDLTKRSLMILAFAERLVCKIADTGISILFVLYSLAALDWTGCCPGPRILSPPHSGLWLSIRSLCSVDFRDIFVSKTPEKNAINK